MFQAKRMLVTGGAGFIGSHFIRQALARFPELAIVNLDLLTYAGSLARLHDLEPERHRFVRGDVADRELVGRLLHEHAIDTIVHFAAESHVDRSIAGPAAFIHTNVVGTFNLLDVARAQWMEQEAVASRRFLYVSTDEVYGSLAQGYANEASRLAPNSPYSASKAAGDHLVRAYHQTYGLPTITTHCSNNYGPFQDPEKFIPTVIRRALAGKPIPLYGDGSQIRDWLHVDDHCAALLTILTRGGVGEVYDIGADNPHTNLALARRICKLLDAFRPDKAPHEALLQHVSDRLGHDRRYAVDSSKLRQELGWRPATSFGEGLADTVAWYCRPGNLDPEVRPPQ